MKSLTIAIVLMAILMLPLAAEAQLFRRACCPSPGINAAQAQAAQTQAIQKMMWNVYILQALDARFNAIDAELDLIHDDTAYIRGYIEGQQVQAQPAQQPQVLMIPSAGSGGFTPSRARVANMRPIPAVQPQRLQPVTTLSPIPQTIPAQ